MDNINESNSKFSYEELLEQNTRLKNQVQEIEEKSNRIVNEYKRIQEIVHIGTWNLDLATNEVEWSDELYKMYGFDPTLPVPPYTEHMKLFEKGSWELLSKSLANTAETGIPYELELKTVKKDKSNGWMWVRGETVIDATGKTIGLWGAAQDITEEKKAEVLISDSEAKYRALYENAPLSYQSLDVDGNFIDINPAWLSTLGYEREEVIGKNYADFLHPDWKSHFEKNFPEFKRRGYVSDVQFKIKHKNGHFIDISFEGSIGTHPDGNFKQTYCVFKDITEQKHAEKSLRRSQEMLLSSQSLANICSYSTDLIVTEIDKSYWECSPEFYKIFGIDETYPHTIKGWIGFVHPDYREDVVAYHESVVLEKKSFNREYKIIRINDGVERWVHGTGELVYDEKGNPIRMHGSIQDVTERKQTELALKEREGILKTTLQTAMDGYWVVDMNGRFLNVNDAYCKMSGYNREDFLSMQISDIEAIQSPEEINENIQKIKQLGQFRFETKHVRKDGSIYDTEIGIQYQERNNGQFVCFIKDITEQKKHEAAIVLAKEVAEQNELKIKLNEQRLKALVELNQMTDKSDDFIYDFTLNKAIELTQSKIGFLGFVNDDESEVEIYKWSDSAMKECAVRNMNMNFIVDETGVWGEVIRQRKPLVLNNYSQAIPNKKGIPVGHVNIKNYLSIPTFQQNKIVAIISVSNKEDDYVQTDINQLTLLLDGMRRFLDQRKEKEALINARQKAEESQMQLELITDNFVNGMIYQVAMLDENRRQFNYISTNVKKLYGCTVKEAKEDANLIYGKLHPDDVMGLIEKEKEALKNMTVFETESRVITPNGNIRWAYYISKPRIINGIVCWDGIEVDITERKQMELELINAKEKAEESERLKSAFLANMSHEIRTPMNGILGFTTLLQDANLSVENQKRYIHIIEKSGNRLLNTVNDIIEISKIESGDINVAKSEVDIIGHLDTLVTFFRPEAEKKNIDIILQNSIDGNDLTITTDKNKLSSILSNLIKNAIKYTNEGRIKVGLKVKNNQVLFSCKDTGIGIPKNRQEAIFNRFEQADIDDKQAHQGSGLGLAIVKTYVEMLDGKIWVESEDGQGSTFYVSLPYEHEKKREQIIPQEAKSSDSGIKNINVLVVEDEEYSSMHLSILLKDKVKSIKTAENGIEAIDACKNDSGIDLILMDIKMPKMNGIEATKKIRKFNKDVVIIAQTAYALEGDEGRALDAGCDDYISKPIDENILFELINKYF